MFNVIKNKKIELLLLIFLALIVSVIFELACMFIVSHFESFYHGFNFARFYFFCGAFLIIITIIYIYKERIKQVETIFLIISLIIGTVMILSSPFGHIAWDLESHLKPIISMSTFDGEISKAEEWFVEDGGGTLFTHSYDSNQDFIKKANDLDNTVVEKNYNSFIISHIPGAIVYGLAKFLGIPFNVRLDLIRFIYLILYSIICYFAIKKLKTNKLIFTTIGLLPTCLFLASNITYDWWVISFSMLGIAYFYSEHQQPDKEIKIYEIVIMSGSIFLGSYIKPIYFLLLFVPLFMKKSYFKMDKRSKIIYYSIVIFFMLLLLCMFLLKVFAINSDGDTRGGTNVNPAEQLNFILTKPLAYTFILINFFTQFMSVSDLVNLTSSFAHLTSGSNLVVARDFGIFIIILAIVTVVDRNSFDKFSTNWLFKILSFIAFFISVILIITALYIDFNNVGSTSMQGIQSRYLIPLLPMLLPTLGFANNAHTSKWPSKNVKTGYSIIMCLFIFWDIAHTMLLQLM